MFNRLVERPTVARLLALMVAVGCIVFGGSVGSIGCYLALVRPLQQEVEPAIQAKQTAEEAAASSKKGKVDAEAVASEAVAKAGKAEKRASDAQEALAPLQTRLKATDEGLTLALGAKNVAEKNSAVAVQDAAASRLAAQKAQLQAKRANESLTKVDAALAAAKQDLSRESAARVASKKEAAAANEEAKKAQLQTAAVKGELTKAQGALTTTNIALAKADEARVVAEKAREKVVIHAEIRAKEAQTALHKLLMAIVSLESAAQPAALLEFIDRRLALKGKAAHLRHEEQAALLLAQSMLLQKQASHLQALGKTQNVVPLLDKAIDAASGCVVLAQMGKSDLVSQGHYYYGQALELRERYSEALKAYESAESHAHTDVEKNRSITAQARVSQKLNSRKSDSEEKPQAWNSSLPPAMPTDVTEPFVTVEGIQHLTGKADNKKLLAQLATVERRIEADKGRFPGRFLQKGHILIDLMRFDEAVQAVQQGIEAMKREPALGDQDTAKGLAIGLDRALRLRKKTPGEKRIEQLLREQRATGKQLSIANMNLDNCRASLKTANVAITAKNAMLLSTQRALDKSNELLVKEKRELGLANTSLTKKTYELADTNKKLLSTKRDLGKTRELLVTKNHELHLANASLTNKVHELNLTKANLCFPALPLSNKALLVVTVEPDAALYVNNNLHSKGDEPTRKFITPPIRPGDTKTYEVRKEYMRDGKAVTLKRDVTLRAGEEIRISMENPMRMQQEPVHKHFDQRAVIAVEVPSGAKLYVNDQLNPDTNSLLRNYVTEPLEPGKSYTYFLRTETVRSGRTFTSNREVVYQAGDVILVTLNNGSTPK